MGCSNHSGLAQLPSSTQVLDCNICLKVEAWKLPIWDIARQSSHRHSRRFLVIQEMDRMALLRLFVVNLCIGAVGIERFFMSSNCMICWLKVSDAVEWSSAACWSTCHKACTARFYWRRRINCSFPPFFFSLVRDVMLQDQIEDMTLFESSLYFYCRLNSFWMLEVVFFWKS